MNWYWLPLLLLLIPIVLLLREPGSILRPLSKPKAPKVYQEPMLRRHTPVRIAEERSKLADWQLEFASLEVQLAVGKLADSIVDGPYTYGQYVSSQVLTYCYEHDRAKFDIFMAHNNRLDMQNLGYSGAQTLKRNHDISGAYDAKRHSDYY